MQVEMLGGGAGSESAMAWFVDTTKAAVCHRERLRGREVSTGCAAHVGNDGGASEARINREVPCDEWCECGDCTVRAAGKACRDRIQAMEATATDAAMMRRDRTAAPAVARRIRHALEYTLVRGVAGALATPAGGGSGARISDWTG